MSHFTSCDTDFNLDTALVALMTDEPFYAELSRHIHKTPSRSLPTAAVAYDPKMDELVMYWNPDFFAKLTPWEVRGVLIHEFNHIVFGHLYGRRRQPGKLWNIATDCAINSLIMEAVRNGTMKRLTGDSPLPAGCIVPGAWPVMPDGRQMTDDEKAANKLAAVIAKFPTLQASEWYFNKLKEESDADKQAGGEGFDGEGEPGGIGTLDDHGAWEALPDDVREYVESKVKAVVEGAVKSADSRANGWGSVPASIADEIRKSVSNIINWRSVLRQFVGSLVRGGRTSSIKRINKRYPYIHPGTKRSYQAKLLVAVDMSGSVDNEMLSEFFAELGSLTKNVTIDVLPFDCEALDKDVFTWRRGTAVKAKRIRAGGTDFNAPTKLANDPKNRGRWDGMLVCTDGEAPAPIGSRIKRGWVLGKGRKLYFGSSELQIHMSDAKQASGAWR
ncbi:MAG: hypothetical protein EBS48_08530 [Actinobacteria bacterium]|nr:hypothetical protein [Actinomycetota bacterium]